MAALMGAAEPEPMQRGTRILLIGFGNMGHALAKGWLSRGRAPATIAIVDPDARARELAGSLALAAHAAVDASVQAPDVVVLAVKPGQLAGVLQACRPLVARRPVFLSIAAGKTISQMRDALGHDARLVRAMPNTPAAIGEGMSVLTAGPAVTPEQSDVCTELLAAVGAVAWVGDESRMDAVTAVSGSGPAYVFLLIECLEQSGIALGLEPLLARQLAIETVAGAGSYARVASESAAQLRRRVTSPGGTTEAALAILCAEGGMPQIIGRAVQAAAARSRELSAA
jgi:pyrroline-5-carboxylate reductase